MSGKASQFKKKVLVFGAAFVVMPWHKMRMAAPQIDLYYTEFLKDCPQEKLKTWNRLRGMMPSWDELHRKYGN